MADIVLPANDTTVKVTQIVQYALTNTERLSYAEEVKAVQAKLNKLEADFKAEKEDYKARIVQAKVEYEKVLHCVTHGEYFDPRGRTEVAWFPAKNSIIITHNGKVIAQRAPKASDQEYFEGMFPSFDDEIECNP